MPHQNLRTTIASPTRRPWTLFKTWVISALHTSSVSKHININIVNFKRRYNVKKIYEEMEYIGG